VHVGKIKSMNQETSPPCSADPGKVTQQPCGGRSACCRSSNQVPPPSKLSQLLSAMVPLRIDCIRRGRKRRKGRDEGRYRKGGASEKALGDGGRRGSKWKEGERGRNQKGWREASRGRVSLRYRCVCMLGGDRCKLSEIQEPLARKRVDLVRVHRQRALGERVILDNEGIEHAQPMAVHAKLPPKRGEDSGSKPLV